MDISNGVAITGLFTLQTIYTITINSMEYTFEMKLALLYLLSCEYLYEM